MDNHKNYADETQNLARNFWGAKQCKPKASWNEPENQFLDLISKNFQTTLKAYV